MNRSKTQGTHTPGPWTTAADGAKHRGVYGADLSYIGTVYFEADEPSPREVGNARLVAAAPDLLAALRLALPLLIRLGDYIANGEGRCEAVLAVRDAIAKAEGGAA